jgi:hypothetical protein
MQVNLLAHALRCGPAAACRGWTTLSALAINLASLNAPWQPMSATGLAPATASLRTSALPASQSAPGARTRRSYTTMPPRAAPEGAAADAVTADGAGSSSWSASTQQVGSPRGEGVRAATQLLDATEERVEQLERRISKEAEAHLGPAPSTDGEEATVNYFAYGSNLHKSVFEGRRRIKPADSTPAVLPGWKLTFAQPGLPYSEPCFAAVEPAAEVASSSNGGNGSNGSSSSSSQPDCHGVVHRITPSQWRYVLETEGASGEDNEDHGYRVVQATATCYDGKQLPVVTLTVPPKINARLQGCTALPSLRYLTLIREGAEQHGLAPEYRAWLNELEHYQAVAVGQRVGALLFGGIAFTSIFPVWAAVRLLRRFTGMAAASDDRVSRWLGRYTAFCFTVVHRMHVVVRPVLGCGLGRAK